MAGQLQNLYRSGSAIRDSRPPVELNDMWCPYTDKEISTAEASPEHILPLALGGCNDFTIAVCGSENATVGTQIDGVIANDPLIAFARRELDARGHTGIAPKVVFKKAAFRGRPAQITFPGGGEAPIIWDAKSRQNIPEEEIKGEQFEITWKIHRFSRLRFVAKVALSAGYFTLGESFRKNVAHGEIRSIMNAGSHDDMKAIAKSIETRVHDTYTQVAGKDRAFHSLVSFCCARTRGSIVMIIPFPDTLSIFVGVLGTYIGMVNVPAKSSFYPDAEPGFDLGHCLVVIDRNLERYSFRDYLTHLKLSMGWSD